MRRPQLAAKAQHSIPSVLHDATQGLVRKMPARLTSRRNLKARQSPGWSEKPARSDVRRSYSFMDRARISHSCAYKMTHV
jgi:hypothetical protein